MKAAKVDSLSRLPKHTGTHHRANAVHVSTRYADMTEARFPFALATKKEPATL